MVTHRFQFETMYGRSRKPRRTRINVDTTTSLAGDAYERSISPLGPASQLVDSVRRSLLQIQSRIESAQILKLAADAAVSGQHVEMYASRLYNHSYEKSSRSEYSIVVAGDQCSLTPGVFKSRLW